MAAGLRPWLLPLALALWPAGLWAQPRLQEAGGGLRAAGDSVTLSCRGSGFTFRDYGIYWYRQAPGGSLEWVSRITYDPTVFYFDQSVQGRAKISRDNSRSEVYLSLLSPHPRDSARYFCAVTRGQETQLSFNTNQLGSASAPTKFGDGEFQSGSGLFLRNLGQSPPTTSDPGLSPRAPFPTLRLSFS